MVNISPGVIVHGVWRSVFECDFNTNNTKNTNNNPHNTNSNHNYNKKQNTKPSTEQTYLI